MKIRKYTLCKDQNETFTTCNLDNLTALGPSSSFFTQPNNFGRYMDKGSVWQSITNANASNLP